MGICWNVQRNGGERMGPRRLTIWAVWAFAALLAIGCQPPGQPQKHLMGAAGGQSGPNPYLSQPTWCIDRANVSTCASDTVNDGLLCTCGTAGHGPMLSAAGIRSLWTGGVSGVRPLLPSMTVTITWASQATVQPDVSDPLSVLMDVDIQNTTLILKGAAPAVAVSGTMATVSAFARTAAAGQIKITDSGVADFSLYSAKSTTNGGLFHDKTTGAISWMYEPSASNATGILTPGRTAQVAGVGTRPTFLGIAAADLYEILTPVKVYFGTGSVTRQYPAGGPAGANGKILIYRLWGTSTGFFDAWQPVITTSIYAGSVIVAQESRIDQVIAVTYGNFLLLNCGLTSTASSNTAEGATALTLFAGFSYASVWISTYGAGIGFDGDHVSDGNQSLNPYEFGSILIGSWSRWGTGSNVPPIFGGIGGGIFRITHLFDAAGPVTYGVVGPANEVIRFNGAQNLVTYTNGQAVAIFGGWDSNVVNWKFQGAATSWAFNPATGRFAGAADGTPAANTWNLLDAAVNAPGYGGTVIDPTGSNFIKGI
jgi:hypothetical protein